MSTSQCGPNQFTCDNECLELSRRCDKIRDCLDRSDEENCGYSSVVLSDFDRIAQLGLFISIGVIGLVLLIILAVVFFVCMRRNKRRQLASVPVIQVPSHYIKTHDGPHLSTVVGSTASGPTNCNGSHSNSGYQQQQTDGPCCYYGVGLEQQQHLGSSSDPLAVPANVRPHCSSRRSNRSRRSTSSGRHRARHVPLDGSTVMQPPSAALSGDSGIAATGSTTVSTSGVPSGRPSSVHSSLHHGRREGSRHSIPAAFRHSYHGNLNQQPQGSNLPQQQQILDSGLLQQHQQQPQPQESSPVFASSSSGVLDTSPPPPYSTFDRTAYAGRLENSPAASNEPSQPQQSTPLSMSQPGVQIGNRANSALLRVEQNVLYGDRRALFGNNNSQRQQPQPHLPSQRVTPSADYTRMWIERVSADAAANQTAAMTTTPALPPVNPTDDTLLAEQSYAQQIRQALRKNQSQNALQMTVSSTPQENTSFVASERVANQTPQSLASGLFNNSSSTPFPTVITPSPTRVVTTPHLPQVITRKPLQNSAIATATSLASSTSYNQQQSNTPIAIIAKRPMPCNV